MQGSYYQNILSTRIHLGWDYEGDDKFWTVTGDNVCSLAILDYDQVTSYFSQK